MPRNSPFVPDIALDLPPFAGRPDLACTPDMAEYFHADRGPKAAQAKALCRSCPVEVECLEWALATKQRGIWGAMTTADRGRERRKRARDGRMAA